ncbi:hypothetical protein [Deinococcus hopiensis]|uniref:Uncharacterized protein n=1 Tax=Deinococcus hopiensis KR-140 TaxID=695939 RepID=A0A1W1UXK6_9DEIO|nr:hypothetical protein [Deinococcus hopiensis]SMB85878.1 hypothetical protein SAMN00790413_03583 [Deinococcus hopiensis KR-140]
MNAADRAALDAAIHTYARSKPFTPIMNLQDMVVALADDNVEAQTILLSALFPDPGKALTPHPVGMAFLINLDVLDVTGHQIYLLVQLAGSPFRAAPSRRTRRQRRSNAAPHQGRTAPGPPDC